MPSKPKVHQPLMEPLPDDVPLKLHSSTGQFYRTERDPESGKRKFKYYGRERESAIQQYRHEQQQKNAENAGKRSAPRGALDKKTETVPVRTDSCQSFDWAKTPSWFTLNYHKGKGQFYRRVRDPLTGKRKMFYYGSDWAEAWRRYCDHKPELEAQEKAVRIKSAREDGRPVDQLSEDSTVQRLAGAWRKLQTERFNTIRDGKRMISPSTFAEYCRVSDQLVAELGKHRIQDLQAQHFMRWREKMNGALATISRRVTIVRQIFAYAQEQHRIHQPYYGDGFSQSSLQKLQENRTRRLRTFEPHQIRSLLYCAPALLKASVLLGINVGFYAVDISELRLQDVEDDFLDHQRHKTDVRRQAVLWPETLAAMEAAKVPNKDDRWFVNKKCKPLVFQYVNAAITCLHCRHRHDIQRVHSSDHRCEKCNRATARQDLHLSQVKNHSQDYVRARFVRHRAEVIRKRPEVGLTRGHLFKCLRHTYATVASEVRDKETLRLTMGHADSSVLNSYLLVDRRPDLQKLSDQVRNWLFQKQCARCGESSVQSQNIWRCSGCQVKNLEFSRV